MMTAMSMSALPVSTSSSAKPDFDARTYGFLKLPDLIEAYPNKYAMKRYPGKGTVTIIAYKCI